MVEAVQNHHLVSPRFWVRIHACFITTQVYLTSCLSEFNWVGAMTNISEPFFYQKKKLVTSFRFSQNSFLFLKTKQTFSYELFFLYFKVLTSFKVTVAKTK
jgi:hypothetical protein